MSEPIVRHQIFEYSEDSPFIILNIYAGLTDYTALSSHWHEELEIAYVIDGNSRHYIDGECVESERGSLIVTNSNSVHSIIPDKEHNDLKKDEIVTIVLLIHKQFMNQYFPKEKSAVFRNKIIASEEIRTLMLQMSRYADRNDYNPYEIMFLKGLVFQLLYHMSKECMIEEEPEADINSRKNIERIKGVIQYVENHYAEPISQREIARLFYFTPEYFSRYFKKCAGVTFKEYLTTYRLGKAREALLETNDSVMDIALGNGFSDDRRLINAFRKNYGTTPLQYRKKVKKQEMHTICGKQR